MTPNTAQVMTEGLCRKHFQVREWHCQSPNLNAIENILKELKISFVHRQPQDFTAQEEMDLGELSNIQATV